MTVNDKLNKALGDLGFVGALPNRVHSHLGSLGHVGAMNDRLSKEGGLKSYVEGLIGGGVTRSFIELDPGLQSHYELVEPITLTGDFTFTCDILCDGAGHIVADNTPSTGQARIAIQGSGGDLWIVDDNNKTVYANAIYPEIVTALTDGRLHKFSFSRVGSTFDIALDGVRIATMARYTIGSFTFNSLGAIKGGATGLPSWGGILANAAFEDLSGAQPLVTEFRLDKGTGDSNALTYVSIPDANRELFTLSGDKTQWDNVSPPPQELPSVLPIGAGT